MFERSCVVFSRRGPPSKILGSELAVLVTDSLPFRSSLSAVFISIKSSNTYVFDTKMKSISFVETLGLNQNLSLKPHGVFE